MKILTSLSAFSLAVAVALFAVSPVLAKIGVGVATGKIVVDEILRPGTVYHLPPLNVVNTGDETSTYGVDVAYNEHQVEGKPPAGWFTFTPKSFSLTPGGTQTVTITLTVPVKSVPGKYFAYLEAFPEKKTSAGESSVGIAAATKLYFQTAPGNLFEGVYYRALSLWRDYFPWDAIIGGAVAGIALVTFILKHFTFTIAKKDKAERHE